MSSSLTPGAEKPLAEFKAVTEKGAHGKTPTLEGKGVLGAILEDLDAGYLTSVRSLIRAEVFTDFLDMAEHLHENGYHHAAVSLTGAVAHQPLEPCALAARLLGLRRSVDHPTSLSEWSPPPPLRGGRPPRLSSWAVDEKVANR